MMFFPGSGARESVSDEEITPALLVERIRSGDQESFDKLYKRFVPMVHGIVLARVPRREAEDIVQEIFITVFRRLDSLNEPDAIGGWIASIARRTVADHYRGEKPSEELPEELVGVEARFGEAFEVLSAIRSLPGAYSETLVMRLVEGMTGPEIAELTGLTHDSVRVNLHRGMKLLRGKLGARS